MSFQNDIKPYFETGDYPTQAQFYELLAKVRWMDVPLAITDIINLQGILNALSTPVQIFNVVGGQQAFTIPQGYLLEYILINPVGNCNCSAQVAAPGDLIIEEPVTAAAGAVWFVNKWAKDADVTILVTGMPDNSKVHFIKKKVIL